MFTLKDAQFIGEEWIAKWNENRLADYRLLYAENAEEVSTLANRLIQYSNGHLKGLNTMINFWELLRHAFPNNRYELKEVNIHNNHILVYFTMTELKSNAIAKLSLNNQRKIERTCITHV
jgi:hypothetical protein